MMARTFFAKLTWILMYMAVGVVLLFALVVVFNPGIEPRTLGLLLKIVIIAVISPFISFGIYKLCR